MIMANGSRNKSQQFKTQAGMVKALAHPGENLRRQNRRRESFDIQVFRLVIAKFQETPAVVTQVRELVRYSEGNQLVQVAERGHLRAKRLAEPGTQHKNPPVCTRCDIHTPNEY